MTAAPGLSLAEQVADLLENVEARPTPTGGFSFDYRSALLVLEALETARLVIGRQMQAEASRTPEDLERTGRARAAAVRELERFFR